MFRSLRHQFTTALPLMALAGLITALTELARIFGHLSSAEGSAGLLGALGDGIDEFGIRTGTLAHELMDFSTDANSWIAAAAIATTAVTVISAVRSIAEWIHGPGDAGGFIQHAVRRVAGALDAGAKPVSWGRVHDEKTGRPLPFARVSVIDDAGAVVARTVADVSGVYGFAEPLQDILSHGGIAGLAVRKSGYSVHERRFPVIAGDVAHSADVPMVRPAAADADERAMQGSMAHAVSTVAFWGGVLTVPMVYYAVQGAAGRILVALFGISAIVRAVGSDSRR